MRRWVRDLLIAALLIFPVVFVSLSYVEDIAETNGQRGRGGLVSLATNLPRNAIALASQAGYGGIFVLMLMEAAAFPIPSEIILPFAGYLVYQGSLEFLAVVFVTTLAALIGSFFDYYLGLKLGSRLMSGKPRVRFLNQEHLRKTEAWFDRYGPLTVALCRLVPGARVLISFPAGVYRMSRLKFGLYTIAGCLPWNIVLIYLGWWLGSSWNTVVEVFRFINIVAYGLLIVTVAWISWRLISKRSV
jgi:membrane protein DedA with SNARE-associated domain